MAGMSCDLGRGLLGFPGRVRVKFAQNDQGGTSAERSLHRRLFRDGETTIKLKLCFCGRGSVGGGEENRPKNAYFGGKLHDDKILKVQISLLCKFCCHCAGS